MGASGTDAEGIGRSQWDDHASTNNRRGFVGNCNRGNLPKSNGAASAKSAQEASMCCETVHRLLMNLVRRGVQAGHVVE